MVYAAAVGVKDPVLYQHFEAKLDLCNAMVDALLGQLETRGTPRLGQTREGNDDQAFSEAAGEKVLERFNG